MPQKLLTVRKFCCFLRATTVPPQAQYIRDGSAIAPQTLRDCERATDDGSVVVTVMVATLTRRVEVLETRMSVIATLPDRVTAVEAQVGLLRTEMHEFRTETKDEFAKVRQEAKDESSTLRQEMRDLNLETRQEMRDLNDKTHQEVQDLSEQMREQLEETNRHMRVLHGEVIDRIRALGEGLDRRP